LLNHHDKLINLSHRFHSHLHVESLLVTVYSLPTWGNARPDRSLSKHSWNFSIMKAQLAKTLVITGVVFIAAGCASSCPGANLNETATLEALEALEARVEGMEAKVSRALRQSAAAKIDSATALLISQQAQEALTAAQPE
jgi:hypothetical protein